MIDKKIHQQGFTILELMIATTVFSVVLLLCTFGLIEIGRNYYKGAAVARTQNVTRTALDSISQAIQYGASAPSAPSSGGTISIGGGVKAICIGDKKFIVAQNSMTVEKTGSTCDPTNTAPSGDSQQLLGTNMRLNKFAITEKDSTYAVIIRVVYGDLDLYNTTTGVCNGGRSSQFCASSELQSTVRRRLK